MKLMHLLSARSLILPMVCSFIHGLKVRITEILAYKPKAVCSVRSMQTSTMINNSPKLKKRTTKPMAVCLHCNTTSSSKRSTGFWVVIYAKPTIGMCCRVLRTMLSLPFVRQSSANTLPILTVRHVKNIWRFKML